jgi:hypothetical protein
LINLGLIYYRSARYDEAEKIFQDGVSKNDGPSMVWLAIIHLRNKNDDMKSAEAERLLETANSLGQFRAKSHLGLAEPGERR